MRARNRSKPLPPRGQAPGTVSRFGMADPFTSVPMPSTSVDFRGCEYFVRGRPKRPADRGPSGEREPPSQRLCAYH
eukprot:5712498-Prymnesium_polylepis.1